MTHEEKQLLLQVLCAMLPYGLKGKVETTDGNGKEIKDEGVLNSVFINEYGKAYICIEGVEYELDNFKPYLRKFNEKGIECYRWKNFKTVSDNMRYLIENHCDINHLIERGLALEAPEGMYETKSE